MPKHNRPAMAMREQQYHNELNLELQGVQYCAISNEVEGDDVEGETASDIIQIITDADDMSKMLITVKKRELLTAMEIGKNRKQDVKRQLKERKKRIDEAKKSE